MSRLRKTVVPFRWSPISITFTEQTAGSVNIAVFLQNPLARPVAYSVVGTLPAGCTFSGTTLSYSGAQSTTASVQFRATWGDFTAESASTPITITQVNPPPPTNTDPVWVNPPASLGTFTAGTANTVSVAPYAFDADLDPMVFYRTGSALDTAPAEVAVAQNGTVTIPATLAAGTYSIEVKVQDEPFIPGPSQADWQGRISGGGVVWAHNFEFQNEIDYHLDMANSAVGASAAPGGYTINRATGFGTHDPRLNAYRVAGQPTSSGFAMEIRYTGARLAAELTPTATSMEVDDASQWPDPNDDATKYYYVIAHADETNPQYQPSNAVPGSKGWKEPLTVRKVTGNTVYFAGRGHTYSESNAGGRPLGDVSTTDFTPTNSGALVFELTPSNFSTANDTAWQIEGGWVYFTSGALDKKGYVISTAVWQPNGNLKITTTAAATTTPAHGDGIAIVVAGKRFLAGCPVGKDVAGGWGRPLMPLNAASSGRGIDDPAASGTITRRSKSPRVKVKDGYYADPFYKTHPEFVNWPSQAASAFDGEDFWIQFRAYISADRRAADVRGGKFFFIDPHSGGGQQQIVGSGPDEDEATAGLFGDFGSQRYAPDNYFQPITNADGTITSNFPTCVVGSKVGCYEWPVGQWFTCMIHIKPGYSVDEACPSLGAGNDTVDDLTVDTTYFTPTNDGTTLTFETTVPPLFEYFPSTYNRQTKDYFAGGGWQFDWPTSSSGATWPTSANQFAGGTALCVGSEVIDHGGVQRMRWRFQKRGAISFTAGVPSSGHKMQMDAFDRSLAFPESYRKHQVDMWIRPDGGSITQVYGLDKYIILFGTGANKFDVNPPGFSEFKPTGYSNVQDNTAPHPSCTYYRFGDIIFSQAQIPWPA